MSGKTSFSLGSPKHLPILITTVVVVAIAIGARVTQLWGLGIQMAIVAFAAVVLALGLWTIRRTQTRLTRLAAVAEAIESGDYGARSTESGTDPVGIQAAALNRVAALVQAVVEEQEATEGEIRRMARYDPLTELPNRRLFEALLSKELARATRAGQLVAVVLLDLDHFNDINSSLGSDAGDQLLRKVAEALTSMLRKEDTLARVGGDEFALLVTALERLEDVLVLLRRVSARFRSPFQLDERELLVSCSMGISLYPEDGKNPEELLQNADSALFRAKSLGRSNFQIFAPSMNRWAQDRLDLEQDLRRGLRQHELTIYCQPQVSLADGEVVGMEALVRWQHPKRGVVEAGKFIPLAEETGVILVLGQWVLGEVCRQNARWQQEGLPRLPISVNISVRQFQLADMAALVDEALAESGLDPEYLHLEITEALAMSESEEIGACLSKLHDRGVSIHMDDFGTGYSSLTYLTRYPVDTLKIDRSFVQEAPGQAESVAIIQAILALAGSLQLGVIAEGVETEDQLAFLRKSRCEVAQGYLLGRPLPVPEFENVLRQRRVPLLH
ncbi:MAG: EAL domain-containing protein [Thermoanaerobaculia bacterium]